MFNIRTTISQYVQTQLTSNEIPAINEFMNTLQRNTTSMQATKYNDTKDYYITGRANLILCAVGLR